MQKRNEYNDTLLHTDRDWTAEPNALVVRHDRLVFESQQRKTHSEVIGKTYPARVVSGSIELGHAEVKINGARNWRRRFSWSCVYTAVNFVFRCIVLSAWGTRRELGGENRWEPDSTADSFCSDIQLSRLLTLLAVALESRMEL